MRKREVWRLERNVCIKYRQQTGQGAEKRNDIHHGIFYHRDKKSNKGVVIHKKNYVIMILRT